MLLAYNTNGLAHHDLLQAIELLAEIGYDGVAITLDHGALNPYDDRMAAQLAQVRAALKTHQMRCVIETGARYLLDPRLKHEPTFVSADAGERNRRVDYLNRAIDVATALRAECVSIWSGTVHDGAPKREAMARLVGSLVPVLYHAERHRMQLAFEPEPGMFIDTVVRYGELLEHLERQRIDVSRLRLTLDIGHLHCMDEVPIVGVIKQWAKRLANVHIEDMRAGVHEHLMFGEGEIDFRPVIAGLNAIGYAGLVSVELSRHSHEGAEAALRAYNFLKPMVEEASMSD